MAVGALVGSLVMDLSFQVPKRPEPGEVIVANEFGPFRGGKGYNQSAALAGSGRTSRWSAPSGPMPTATASRRARARAHRRGTRRATARLCHRGRGPADHARRRRGVRAVPGRQPSAVARPLRGPAGQRRPAPAGRGQLDHRGVRRPGHRRPRRDRRAEPGARARHHGTAAGGGNRRLPR